MARSRRRVLRSLLGHLATPVAAAAEEERPRAPGATAEDYAVGEGFLSWHLEKTVRNGEIAPRWVCDGADPQRDVLTYVRQSADGKDELVIVDVGSMKQKTKKKDDAVEVVMPTQVALLLAEAGAQIEDMEGFKLEAFKMLSPTSLLLRHDGAPFRVDLDVGTATQLADDGVGKSEVPSPDGELVLFAASNNLHLRTPQSTGGTSRALTTDGVEHFSYGGPTGATHVSLARKSGGPQQPRPAAIWSPDSAKVLTSRVDEREIEEYHLIQSAPEDGSMRPKLWSYKYALPGDPVPPASLLVIEIGTGNIVPIDVASIFGDEHDAGIQNARSTLEVH
jgi:dipeptidyl-peptidase-4